MNDRQYKINVLFVIVQIDVMGGSERLVYNLIEKMDREIFTPSLAWFYGNAKKQDFKNLDIALYRVPKEKRFDLAAMNNIARIVKDNNIHIINAHHFMSMVYSFYASTRHGSSLIYTEHSAWEIEQISWIWKTLGKLLLRRADAAIGVSNAVSLQLKKIFETDDAKTTTILNGTNLQSTSGERAKAEGKKKLGLGEQEKIIGMVANFKRVKNHIFLLKAFNELAQSHHNVKLVLIGQDSGCDPENEQEIKTFVMKHNLSDKLLVLGYRRDVQDLLKTMDVVCLTSLKEGLPISIIEAMAAGLPVVGTDVEGIRDVIIPGKNGFLVGLGDTESLKNALAVLITDSDLRNQFGRESRLLSEANYSMERCVGKYQNLFISRIQEKNRTNLRSASEPFSQNH